MTVSMVGLSTYGISPGPGQIESGSQKTKPLPPALASPPFVKDIFTRTKNHLIDTCVRHKILNWLHEIDLCEMLIISYMRCA